MFQCYYTTKEGKRCQNKQKEYWCSAEHKELEQKTRYGDLRPRGERQLPIKEIQERLLKFGKAVTLDDKTDETSGQMLIIPKSEIKHKQTNFLDH